MRDIPGRRSASPISRRLHMKYLKMLALLSAAMTILLAFAGTASALITSPAGSAYTGNVRMASTNITLHASVTIECKESTIALGVINGATTGNVTTLDFTECGPDTVTAKATGTRSIGSNGTVIATSSEVTAQIHRSVLGFPITTHCIWITSNTDVGTLTEGVDPPVIHIGSSTIPRITTDGACGDTSVLTGTYTVTEPKGALTVD
jgi:hypothetical protein